MNAESFSQADPTTNTPLLFQLGTVVTTPGALDLLVRAGMNATAYLARHQTGDFGTLSSPDLQANQMAITYASRILSAYDVGGERLWMITEADRCSTTLLLPSEY